jgi:hypothetical protein
MAKAKKPGTALVKWEEELEGYATETAKGISVSEGKFISFKGGRMSFAGADIPDDEFNGVIIGWTHHNAYYDPDIRYDADNPQTPICYAFGQDEEEMQPHEDSKDKQCDSCAECPFSKFESAKTGRGKACKNTFRLAIIAESDLDDIDSAEVVYLSVPPTSLKNFANYLAKDLKNLKRPHWFVKTLISRVPDDTSQFRVTFKHVESIEDGELYEPLKALWKKTMEGIDFPYQEREPREPKRGGRNTKPAARGKAAPKKAGKINKFARNR